MLVFFNIYLAQVGFLKFHLAFLFWCLPFFFSLSLPGWSQGYIGLQSQQEFPYSLLWEHFVWLYCSFLTDRKISSDTLWTWSSLWDFNHRLNFLADMGPFFFLIIECILLAYFVYHQLGGHLLHSFFPKGHLGVKACIFGLPSVRGTLLWVPWVSSWNTELVMRFQLSKMSGLYLPLGLGSTISAWICLQTPSLSSCS